jgi:hypothetical protein
MNKALAGLGITALSIALTGMAAPAQAADGTETVTVYYNSNVEGPSLAVAHGPIAGAGRMTAEPIVQDTAIVTLDFHSGTVKMQATITSEVLLGIDFTTCKASVDVTGRWSVISGTGAYSGAQGSGEFGALRHIYGDRVAGQCQGPDSGREPRQVRETLHFSGAVTIP